MSDEPKGKKPDQAEPSDEEKVAAAPRATLRFGGQKKGPVPCPRLRATHRHAPWGEGAT
jgi:hypothetical protein